MRHLVVLVLVAGCTSPNASFGPPAADEERALQLAWDQTMAMEPAARPHVTWVDEANFPVHGFPTGWCTPEKCVAYDVDQDTGDALIIWRHSIAESGFPYALADWCTFLGTGAWPALGSDFDLARRAKHALDSASL